MRSLWVTLMCLLVQMALLFFPYGLHHAVPSSSPVNHICSPVLFQPFLTFSWVCVLSFLPLSGFSRFVPLYRQRTEQSCLHTLLQKSWSVKNIEFFKMGIHFLLPSSAEEETVYWGYVKQLHMCKLSRTVR